MSAHRDPIHKLAANYLAFVKLVSIRIWLRANASTALTATVGLDLPKGSYLASATMIGLAFRFSVPLGSPEACASTVVRLTMPAPWSIAVVCTVAISCWPKVLRTMSSPLASGA